MGFVVICAWCQRYLGTKPPERGPEITHSICAYCSERLKWKQGSTLVFSRSKAHMLPVLAGLLQGEPEIHLVVDRRSGPRRAVLRTREGSPERRTGRDRRKDANLQLC